MFGSRTEGLFKSTDGGISWESVGMIGSPTERIGILSIVFDPSSKGRVYANVYGDGIYSSADGGDSWSPISGSPSGVLRMSIDSNLLFPKDETRYVAGRNKEVQWIQYRVDTIPPAARQILREFLLPSEMIKSADMISSSIVVAMPRFNITGLSWCPNSLSSSLSC